jgi:bifunctional non-homologous end joining protein LigD
MGVLNIPSNSLGPSPSQRPEIGPYLFRHACKLGFEELVSKHRERPLAGRSPWLKVKIQTLRAMNRMKEMFG